MFFSLFTMGCISTIFQQKFKHTLNPHNLLAFILEKSILKSVLIVFSYYIFAYYILMILILYIVLFWENGVEEVWSFGGGVVFIPHGVKQ